MFGAPLMSSKSLAILCRRLCISLEAGVDVRKVWANEASRARWPWKSRLETIAAKLARGEAVDDAIEATSGLFPRLFREMASVGEQTGSLPEVLRRLAEHYEHQQKLRRVFLVSATWPLFQLSAALAIVGLVIWLPSVFSAKVGGGPIDLLGIGLTGGKGLLIYVAILATLALIFVMFVVALRRGALWAAPVQLAVMKLPGVGRAFETLALARIAWTLELTLGVAMDLRRVLSLALRSTGNYFYARHADEAANAVASGVPIPAAMAQLGVFPSEFLAAAEVGEESGTLPQTMGQLSRGYEEQSRAALTVISVAGGFVVWGFVALLIITLIFRLAMAYLGILDDALKLKV